MATTAQPQTTDFTIDVLGRYICNGLDEALRSANQSLRPDARPFDIVIVGGGTFGAALAQHLFYLDKARGHRILVLEGGPFVLTDHVQDLPMVGLNVPGPTSIAKLRAGGQDGKPREQVWGLAWHANTDFPGLAYCVGGRSLYWGGWSPRLLADETRSDTPINPWPAATVADLNSTYFRQASEQIGVLETNDFIFGPFQNALRQQLFAGLQAGNVAGAVPLSALPDHPAVVFGASPPSAAELVTLLGLPHSSHPPTRQDLLNLLKLEAPLAVQASTGSGFFPFNKFSAMPVLMEAARVAESESAGDDVEKRLMVVPRCHVERLITDGGQQVTGIDTSQGHVPLPAGGAVVVALGTIESTRLALDSFRASPHASLIGRNLMAHLRSNLTIRVPRAAIQGLDPTLTDLQAACLFVKGEHTRSDGTPGHFHFQITAAGLKRPGTDSEAELFKKIPDIDTIHLFKSASPDTVVITIRGIGEMQCQNPNNFVRLDPEQDEYGVQRAFVSLAPSAADLELWDAMDAAADQVAAIFAAGGVPEVIAKNRDGFGTTHHEAGTLWMGNDPARSVTNANGRFHDMANAYVASPALFPTIGSPNPMLTGIALGRRLAEHLCPAPTPYAPADGSALFDGISPTQWHMAGPGRFIVVDGALESVPGGGDIGLLWCGLPMPADFILHLEWMRTAANDNSGVFVRFPDPNSKGYNNPAWVAVNYGFEVQIDEFGAPAGAAIHKTGAIYAQPNQTLSQLPAKPPGEWNQFEIRVQGQTYTVLLNGAQVTLFQNHDPARGLATTAAAPSYVGLQSHTGRVRFRNIRVASLAPAAVAAPVSEAVRVA